MEILLDALRIKPAPFDLVLLSLRSFYFQTINYNKEKKKHLSHFEIVCLISNLSLPVDASFNPVCSIFAKSLLPNIFSEIYGMNTGTPIPVP
jgi:hypothetical protein